MSISRKCSVWADSIGQGNGVKREEAEGGQQSDEVAKGEMHSGKVAKGEMHSGKVAKEKMHSGKVAKEKMQSTEEAKGDTEWEGQSDGDFVREYINNHVKSIEDVEQQVDKMNREIIELDKVISEKVESHILQKNAYERKLKNVREKMKIINEKMENVDRKTEESEEMLVNLCKDIKKLDTGKRNVTETIIILKRIVMIITAISSLKKKAIKRDYKSCISLVSVIKEMLTHISELKRNDKLRQLYNDANVLFDELKQQIKEDIELIYDSDVHIEGNIAILNEANWDAPPQASLLHDNGNKEGRTIHVNLFHACTCLYHVSPSFINHIAKSFTSFFLDKYILIFQNQANTLDSIDRRLAWLKRELNNYENTYGHIFPKIYNIPFLIVSKFCSITKKHIVKILSFSMEEMNPVSLIQTVIKVINFENFLTKNIFIFSEGNDVPTDDFSSLEFPFPELIMQREFSQMGREKYPSETPNMDNNEEKEIKKETSSSLYMSRERNNLKRGMHNQITKNLGEGLTEAFRHPTTDRGANEKIINGDHLKEGCFSDERDAQCSATDSIPQDRKKKHNFRGVISCVFDSYLCSWLKYEEKKIYEKFKHIIKEEIEEENFVEAEKGVHMTEAVNSGITASGVKRMGKESIDDVKTFLNKNEYIPDISFEIAEEKHIVYKSAYKIFYLYKSYVNMILLFSNCKTLHDFVLFFKTLWIKYSDELNRRMITKINEKNITQNIHLICTIINTSYYVEHQINEAYETLGKNIDPAFIDQISFKEEEKNFLTVKTKCIKIVISFIQEKINSMISKSHIVYIHDIGNIQETSSWITNLDNFLWNYFTILRKISNETYLIYLMEKTTTLIINQFYQTIFSLKRLQDLTAQQLLLDCYALQKVLFRLPHVVGSSNSVKDTNNIQEEAREPNICTDTSMKLPDLIITSYSEKELDADDSIIPKTYFTYVKNQINKIELLIKIFLSNIYDVNSFNLLLTENNNICTIQEIEQILSLKEEKGENLQRIFGLNKNYVHDIKKRGMKAAEEVKFFFNKITSR
ncbi:vacuolar protein sorting-associated protein 53, putative (VPS53) [Plasmodium ovale wallikeri]|uniref:Vacuolar protein sorting-associated protein 53, putative (VPS53) n=1 Tax=Plasmodium ovale wallikeri TaxID=864142 RepID=A0A1A8YGY0_PLAOA|nr:vacuolar protein sorting-associated protein 53, putative (VPS53) [Plasmodium ovale wallikeri]SBT31411.1 vacuolar protein sorting-associated protein 53, putative (VPS53) [Plasmodium ovale wallikeri]